MKLIVNGVDLTPYIMFGGLKWSRNDVDGENTGRTIDGVMHRDRIATKIRLDVNCRPLRSNEISIVLSAVQPEYVSVSYDDPLLGDREGVEMYSNNIPASFMMIKPDGTEWWNGVSFPLIER